MNGGRLAVLGRGGPVRPRLALCRSLALAVVTLAMVFAGLSGATAQPSPGSGTSGSVVAGLSAYAGLASPTCAGEPQGAGCQVSSLTIDTGALAECGSDCSGFQVGAGDLVRAPVVARWSDGTSGPLDALTGSAGPRLDVVAAATPAGSFSAPVIVNGAGGAVYVATEAFASTTSPLSFTVSYGGASSGPLSLNATAATPTCGGAGELPCHQVNAALVQISVTALTGTAASVPVGGFVAVSQDLGGSLGAEVPGNICYPASGPGGSACGPVPSGLPASAPASGCDLGATGSCDVAAAWTVATAPDAISLYPPSGWAVSSATGCSGPVGGTPEMAVCAVAPASGTGPLAAHFLLVPYPTVEVDAQGPPEPPLSCGTAEPCPGVPTVYDDDVMNGVVATIGAASTGSATCTLGGGVPGDVTTDQPAACQLTVPPGTYDVTLPLQVPASQGVPGIPYAYVTDGASLALTVPSTPGNGQVIVASFTSAYEPELEVEVTGPPVPCQFLLCTGSSATDYDSGALNGDTVSVTPSAGGVAATCTLDGGVSGDPTTYASPASCQVYVPPGAYTVALPATLPTPDSLSGATAAYPSGPSSQSVVLAAGDVQQVQFATSGPPEILVQATGPAEPACAYGLCLEGATAFYDNDVLDGLTVTAAPADGNAAQAQTCQLQDGYPGDATSGQPASCLLTVSAGTYAVSLPASFPTPASEVGIATAYVSGPSSQVVTVGTGADIPQVSFTTVYQPTVQVQVDGPEEPSCANAGGNAGTCGTAQAVYDDDAVNGQTVTVSPGAGGDAQTCQLSGGVTGASGEALAATCSVSVAPGQYVVSLPARSAPAVDHGWGYVQVVGASSRSVQVSAGDAPTVEFSTAYAAPARTGTGGGAARTSDGLVTVSGTGGSGSLSVGEYPSDPEAPLAGLAGTSVRFFRVSAGAGAHFSKVTVTVCGLDRFAELEYFWDASASASASAFGTAGTAGAAGAWEPVSGRWTGTPVLTPGGPGCLVTSLGATSAPDLARLGASSGTVFAIPVGLPAQTLMFSSRPPSPARPGQHYLARAVASSGLGVTYSAATGGSGACSVSPDGVVVFRSPGTCLVVAWQAGSQSWALVSARRAIKVASQKPVARPQLRGARWSGPRPGANAMQRVASAVGRLEATAGSLSRRAAEGRHPPSQAHGTPVVAPSHRPGAGRAGDMRQ